MVITQVRSRSSADLNLSIFITKINVMRMSRLSWRESLVVFHYYRTAVSTMVLQAAVVCRMSTVAHALSCDCVVPFNNNMLVLSRQGNRGIIGIILSLTAR